jgi:hypothetical protein
VAQIDPADNLQPFIQLQPMAAAMADQTIQIIRPVLEAQEAVVVLLVQSLRQVLLLDQQDPEVQRVLPTQADRLQHQLPHTLQRAVAVPAQQAKVESAPIHQAQAVTV